MHPLSPLHPSSIFKSFASSLSLSALLHDDKNANIKQQVTNDAQMTHFSNSITGAPLINDVPIHTEQIVLSGVGDVQAGHLQVTLRTTTTLAMEHSDNNDEDNGDGDGQISLHHLHPMDSVLVSMMERYDLQSLTISVSSSSASMTKLDENSHSYGRNFPVGTAVQFVTRARESTTSSSASRGVNENSKRENGGHIYNDNKYDVKTKIEYDLMRILSSKNLFCENVQLEPFYNGIVKAIPMPMPMRIEQHASGAGSNATNENVDSKIIMLPNDAFSLCHTRALWDKIVSSAPCRDRAGVYSHLQWDLNGIDIIDKASWMHLERIRGSIDGDGISGGQRRRSVVEIEKELDFTRWMSSSSSDSGITLSNLLTGRRYEGSHTDSNPSVFKHCPLTESSTMTIYEANGDSTLHDLEGDDYDMNDSINIRNHLTETETNAQSINAPTSSSIYGDDTAPQTNSNNKKTTMGIERYVVRLNGIANGGMLQTRAYFSHHQDESEPTSKESFICGGDESVHVNIVDVFPNFISPFYHTMRILLVEGAGAGSEFNGFNPSATVRTTGVQKRYMTTDGNYTITQFQLGELDHQLLFSPGGDGSSTLSISTTIPKDSSLYIQVDYNPRFLAFERFPADPNRGFDVPPSIASFSCPLLETFTSAQAQAQVGQVPNIFRTNVYSNALLIMPPVPDLSMPFNVISITSTLFALIIGTFINLLIHKSRESIKEKFDGNKNPKSKLGKLKDKLKAKINRLRSMTTLVKRKKVEKID